MGYYRYFKYKPSKTKIKAFKEKMSEIDSFCDENGIIQSSTSDSYYFEINNQKYRVSNHSVELSNVNSHGNYHEDGRRTDTIYIHASKTRIIEIYNNLKLGKKLNGRGEIVYE